MTHNKNGLDEMQVARQGAIGNQMFTLLSLALLFNISLYSFGIRWLDYPTDVMIILNVCFGIYLIRLIAANAYLPSDSQNKKTVIGLIAVIVLSIALGVLVTHLWQPSAEVTENTNDYSAIILVLVSAAGLLGALIAAIIKKAHNNKEEEA